MNKFDRSIAVGSKALGGGQGSGGSFLSCLGFMAAGKGQEDKRKGFSLRSLSRVC